jgi:DNA-directed RNA polymerase specialized sigma24 family protein
LELSPEDVTKVDNLIRAMASITCRRWGLRREQVVDDMIQDCWVEVLRVKDRYDPARASLITFLYLSITRVCGRSAQKIKKRGIAEFPIDERHSTPDATDRIEALDILASSDVRVVAAAMGFNDSEIAEQLGEPVRETTRRRRAASREIGTGV